MVKSSCQVTDLQFALSCLSNMKGDKVDFATVASATGMTSASAASQKLAKLQKKEGIPAPEQADAGTGEGGAVGRKAKQTSGKKGTAKTGASSKKRKLEDPGEMEASQEEARAEDGGANDGALD